MYGMKRAEGCKRRVERAEGHKGWLKRAEWHKILRAGRSAPLFWSSWNTDVYMHKIISQPTCYTIYMQLDYIALEVLTEGLNMYQF